jgi:hypothetical protein
MAQNIHLFLSRAKEAALLLDEQEPLDLITAVEQQIGAARLRLLVIGAPGGGRFSLVNALLQQPGLLPASPLPRAPLPVQLTHHETPAVEVLSSDGIASVMPGNHLHAFLTGTDTDSTRYEGLHIKSRSDLLTSCDMRIETLGGGRSTGEWKAMLANSDFVLLVLNAVALLSGQERRFIRDVLQPAFGLERVALVINKMDLVDAEERASIAELVRTFLGPFESQPALLELSAAQAVAGIESGDIPASSGYETLLRLVNDDLLGRHGELKAAAVRQAAELCVAALEEALQRRQALLNADEAELRRMLEKLDPQSDWLASRIERAQHRVEAFVSTLVKEQFLRDIEAFSNAFREQLPDEIMAVNETGTVKQHLPGYLESVWGEFFTYHLPPLRNRLIDEMQQVGDLVVSDLQELLDDQSAQARDTLGSFNPVPPSMKAFIMPARGHHPAGRAATFMQVGGLMLLISLPQISLILLGVGQAVRMFFQRDITTADKQALVTSVTSTTHDLEQQIKQQVTRHFETLTEQLKQTVSDMYTQTVEAMRANLQENIARHAEVSAQREQLERLANEKLPPLRQMLARMQAKEG